MSSSTIPKVPYPIFSGDEGTSEDKESGLLCPICFELMREPHVTPCGHSFCRECLSKSLARSLACPKCGHRLESRDAAFPNFSLNDLVGRVRAEGGSTGRKKKLKDLEAWLEEGSGCDEESLPELDRLISRLTRKRRRVMKESFLARQFLLKEFLANLKKAKEDEIFQLKKEVSLVSADLSDVEGSIQVHMRDLPANDNTERELPLVPEGAPSSTEAEACKRMAAEAEASCHSHDEDFRRQRQRMLHHFDDLVACYLDERSSDLVFPREDSQDRERKQPEQQRHDGGPAERNGRRSLDSFANCLSRFTRYSALSALSTMSFTSDLFSSASIVSSIEFDKDSEFFAIAGVTKRIKVHEYAVVIRDQVDLFYPNSEMHNSSKISCVSWNWFLKSCLASSDYEGNVVLWDTVTNKRTRVYQEHEKRCWSVDFNSMNTKLLASGSDDARVKLWSTNSANSVASLEAKANVCCVKFNPSSSYHLAYGSADHCVHYYDLRSTKQPLAVFRGHKKAVSYVKFLDQRLLVSASTDSQLKLWDASNSPACIRSYVGHTNEKNFVGLATDGDFLSCGSEDNALYVYYKGLSSPLFSFKFDSPRPLLERGMARENDGSEFVSAVCWRRGTNVVVGANSQGNIKILELR